MFDTFCLGLPVLPYRTGAADAVRSMIRSEPEALVRILEEDGAYRVLRRVPTRTVVGTTTGRATAGLRTGIVLDTETTGLDARTDEIIELGMIRFSFDDAGIRDVLEVYEGLQKPTRPLSPTIRGLTGLTDRDLSDKRIDPQDVADFVGGTDLMIAHNANFDRPFVEARFPFFRAMRWACSLQEVPWRTLGVDGTRLGCILQAYKLFHDGHRAVADCHALLEVLARLLPNGGRTAFAHLLDAAEIVTAEISAIGAPYEIKDLLKSRGYRWSPGDDGRPRAWWRQVAEEDVPAELVELARLYGRPVDVPVVRLDARSRFRPRCRS